MALREGRIAGAVTGLGGRAGLVDVSDERCPETPKSYKEVVDLTKQHDLESLNARLRCYDARLKLDNTSFWGSNTGPFGNHNNAESEIAGIVYRTPVDISVNVQKYVQGSSSKEPIDGTSLALLQENLGEHNDALGAAKDYLAIKQSELAKAETEGSSTTELKKVIEIAQADVKKKQKLAEDAESFYEKAKSIEFPDEGWVSIETVSLKLPQAGPISVIRQNAGAFVKSEYNLAFEDGILTEYSSDRPSEILAVAETPLKVIDGFFEGISQVISLRTGRANDLAALSDAQLRLLNSRSAEERGVISNQRLLSTEEVALVNQLAQTELATVNNQAALSSAQQALITAVIQAEYVAEITRLREQVALAGANQELIQTLAAGQNALTNNQQTSLTAQLALLNQQNALAVSQAGAPAALYAAQVDALIQTQIQNELRQCVETQIEAKESIEICLQ